MKCRIEEVNYDNSDFKALCTKLDEFQNELIPERIGFNFSALNELEKLKRVLLVYDNDKAVASASLKEIDETTAEISRIYTEEEYRGKGLAEMLIKEIIKFAQQLEYSKLILYTWKGSTSAINLYRKMGFIEVPLDKEKTNKLKRIDELTVYMEKKI